MDNIGSGQSIFPRWPAGTSERVTAQSTGASGREVAPFASAMQQPTDSVTLTSGYNLGPALMYGIFPDNPTDGNYQLKYGVIYPIIAPDQNPELKYGIFPIVAPPDNGGGEVNVKYGIYPIMAPPSDGGGEPTPLYGIYPIIAPPTDGTTSPNKPPTSTNKPATGKGKFPFWGYNKKTGNYIPHNNFWSKLWQNKRTTKTKQNEQPQQPNQPTLKYGIFIDDKDTNPVALKYGMFPNPDDGTDGTNGGDGTTIFVRYGVYPQDEAPKEPTPQGQTSTERVTTDNPYMHVFCKNGLYGYGISGYLNGTVPLNRLYI